MLPLLRRGGSCIRITVVSILSISLLVVSCSSTIQEQGAGTKVHRKVKLADVSSLTFKNGLMTTSRRSEPVPQVTCVPGGTVKCSQFSHPPNILCHNSGFDGLDVVWKCEADIDSNYQFGHVEVTCEGFDYPEDPYVLFGSCGLEYNLNYDIKNINKNEPKAQVDPASTPIIYCLRLILEFVCGISFKVWILLFGVVFVVYCIYVAYVDPFEEEEEATGNDTRAFWTGVGIATFLGALLHAIAEGRSQAAEHAKKDDDKDVKVVAVVENPQTADHDEKGTTQEGANAATPETSLGPSGALTKKFGYGTTKRR